MGLKLFTREKRRLIPTVEGEAFYSEAERILDSIDQVPNIVSQIKRGPRKHTHIITMPRIAESILIPTVSRFLTEHPEEEVSVDVQPRHFMERWVASQKFDIGIGALPADHATIVTESICSVPAVVVLHPSHELASRREISIEDLANERLIMMTPETLIGRQITRLFDDAGVIMNSQLHVSQIGMSCYFVINGIGVAITDALIASAFGNSIKMVPLVPRLEMSIGLLYPEGVPPSPAIEHLARITREEVQSQVDQIRLP